MPYVSESFFKRARSLRHALLSRRLTLRGSSRQSQARPSASRALALATMARVDEARTLAEAAIPDSRRGGCGAARRCDCRMCDQDSGAGSGRDMRGPPEARARLGCPRLLRDGVPSEPGAAQRAALVGELPRQGTLSSFDAPETMTLLASLGLSASAIVDPVATLSAREQEVYALVCEGLSNAEIGRRLFIAESTVKAHTHRLYDKLGRAFEDRTPAECCSAHLRDAARRGSEELARGRRIGKRAESGPSGVTIVLGGICEHGQTQPPHRCGTDFPSPAGAGRAPPDTPSRADRAGQMSWRCTRRQRR